MAANIPDLDVAFPFILDRLGVPHHLRSGEHHGWASHAPVCWIALTAALSQHTGRSPLTRILLRMISAGAAVHLTQDATANTLAIFWPHPRRWGLRLDGLAGDGVMLNHLAYARRYRQTAAWRMELATVAFAAAASVRALTRTPATSPLV